MRPHDDTPRPPIDDDHADGHHEHDLGLIHDLEVMDQRSRLRPPIPAALSRRRALGMIGGGAVAAVALAACDAPAGQVTGGGCSIVPTETAGPYPGDGSNGPNVLNQSGVVRSDIRSSFGSYSGTAPGIKLNLRIVVRDVSGSCSNLVGAAVYAWHCTRDGAYSLYSSGHTSQNYLRGVQATDSDGAVLFTTIFPGCYAGRWPHIHFEVFPSLASATSASNKILTSQIALPEAACRQVYATSGYGTSLTNLNGVSLSSDGIFRDGVDHQMAAVGGNTTDGYIASLTVGTA
ncbi:MAG: intradiol ring-cleavage dioxygenase [Actinobacteria bacterium]|nr:intradiol ring-cleavage dioxygenase [Actinomycetota bacterium]